MHYKRWVAHGDPLYLVKDHRPSKDELFWQRVVKGEGCWGWTGTTSGKGYSSYGYKGKTIYGHRHSYEIHYGEIPEGLVVDHICHTVECTNPEHLRLATISQNGQNLKETRSNTSGYRGVWWNEANDSWASSVTHQRKSHWVGRYPPYELHIAGYKAMMKRNELFTHNDKDRISV